MMWDSQPRAPESLPRTTLRGDLGFPFEEEIAGGEGGSKEFWG
jgi:hypothetical protein